MADHAGDAPASTGPADVAAFDVVPVAITTYRADRDAWRPLPEVDSEARAIGDILEQLGGRFQDWAVGPDERDLAAVTERLHEWAAPDRPRSSVLVWLGHGMSNDDAASLIVPAGRVNHPLGPEELAMRIVDEHRRRSGGNWAIIVIEACGAERYVQLVGSQLLRDRAVDGVLVVGSGADLGQGYLASFRAALARVCASYTGNDTRITLGDIGHRLADALPRGHVFFGRFTDSAALTPSAGPLQPITVPVDVYGELRTALAALPPPERIHFARKGMGAHLGEFGWHFAGREVERAAIAHWLADTEHGLLVLTGAAGTGKSAILGNMLLHTRPEIRSALAGAGLLDGNWPDAPVPPPIDAALLLTGASLHEVADWLAEVGGVDLSAGTTGSERATELVRRFREHGSLRLTVLTDGLDEAEDAVSLAGLLRDVSAIAGVRLVVGTRPGLPGPDGDTLLAELGGHADHVTVQWVRRDPKAIATYVSRRLRVVDRLRASLGDRLDDILAAVIGAIAADSPTTTETSHRDQREFLHAHLAVHELLADDTLLLPEHQDRLNRILGMTTRELFGHALARMVQALPASGAFLAALAHARGRGLPRADQLWVAVATVVAGEGNGASEADLDEVLRLAGPYIMLDSVAGQSVYRLAHRTFQEHFAAAPDFAERASLIAQKLLDVAVGQADLGTYLRRHLSGHLADLGLPGWQALERQLDVLDKLDIAAIVSDGMRTQDGPGRLPTGVRGAFMSAHLASAAGPADRAGLRQLGQARAAGFWSASMQADSPPVTASAVERDTRGWELRWADVRRHAPHATLAGHAGVVRALTAFPGHNGQTLLASAGDDRTLRLWDPTRARAVRSDLTRFAGPVLALAWCELLDGAMRLVAVGDNDPVRFVEPHNGRLVAGLPSYRAGVDRAMAVLPAFADLPRVAVTGTQELSVWDSAGQPIGRVAHGHAGWVQAIAAVVAVNQSPLIVTAGGDRRIRVWTSVDIAFQREWTATAPIRSITVLPRPGSSDLVATGSDDGLIHCWDPINGRQVGQSLAGHTGAVLTLAALPLSAGRVLLASGGVDGTVRTWTLFDATDTEPAGQVLIGHAGPVSSVVAFVGAHGGARLASAGRDGTVRIWTPLPITEEPAESSQYLDGPASILAPGRAPDGTSVLIATTREGTARCWDAMSGQRVDTVTSVTGFDHSPLGQHANTSRSPVPVRATIEFIDIDDRKLTAEAGQDGAVRVWAADTGQPCGGPLAGHPDWATALGVAVDPTGRRVLLTGDDDTVRMWRPGTTSPIYVIPLGTRVRSLVQIDNDIAIGTDEGVLMVRPEWDRFAESRGQTRWSDD